MKSWWQSLAKRERLFLSVGIVFLIVVSAYVFVYTPMVRTHERMQEDLLALRAERDWMRQASREAAALVSQQKRRGAVSATQSPLLAVQKSADAMGVRAYLTRFETESNNAVRVRLEDVPLDAMVFWLQSLARDYGLSVRQLALEPAESPNTCHVSLSLEA
ncbi:MAG: type II secretion system protein GspM [Pseudomonadota bacterium]|nr:type II secretion system protein GspM [Pseudomonadota bacterium]